MFARINVYQISISVYFQNKIAKYITYNTLIEGFVMCSFINY